MDHTNCFLTEGNELAGPGEVFLCPLCGRRSKDRDGNKPVGGSWDTSCRSHAVRVLEASIVTQGGRIISARAVPKN